MADTTQIKNPSLLPGDLNIKLSGDAITAISGHPLIGTGGGTQSDWVYVPSFNTETGKVLFELGTTGDNPQPEGGWYISGAQGPQGPQGEQGIQGETGPAGADGSDGTDGKTPELRINPSNAEWQWKYTTDQNWIDLGVTASGSVGPQGQSGASGASGISPTVTTAAIPGEDGTRVTFTYGPGGDSTYIDVMNGTDGAAGASGESGYSPTITTATTADAQHPQSGVNVTVTDIDGNKSFNIWNGIDGQGATVNLLEGDGIQITHESSTTNYTIAVSANYSGAATAWVNDQNYLTEVPNTYATKTWVEEQNYLASVYTSGSVIGDGTSTNKIGLKTSAENALLDVAKKTPLPDNTYSFDFGIWDTRFNEWANPYYYFTHSLDDDVTPVQGTQYVLNYNGEWEPVSGTGITAVSANSPISGNGTNNQPLGIDSDNFYELDTTGNYLTSQTSNQKTIISTTPALDNAVDRVITSADVWDTVSAKSVVTINSANNEIKVNNNPNSAISATIYDECNTSEPTLIPQRLIVGTSSGDFVTYVNGGECDGQGTLFFWLESMQPWVPVNN